MSDLSAAIVRLEEAILRARSREGGSLVKRIMLDVSDVELLIQEASYADALQAEVERTQPKDSMVFDTDDLSGPEHVEVRRNTRP